MNDLELDEVKRCKTDADAADIHETSSSHEVDIFHDLDMFLLDIGDLELEEKVHEVHDLLQHSGVYKDGCNYSKWFC